MPTRIVRRVDSLALRIPRPVAERLGLDAGSMVELSATMSHLAVRPRRPEPRLDELLAGIRPENVPSSFDDALQGKEAL